MWDSTSSRSIWDGSSRTKNRRPTQYLQSTSINYIATYTCTICMYMCTCIYLHMCMYILTPAGQEPFTTCAASQSDELALSAFVHAKEDLVLLDLQGADEASNLRGWSRTPSLGQNWFIDTAFQGWRTYFTNFLFISKPLIAGSRSPTWPPPPRWKWPSGPSQDVTAQHGHRSRPARKLQRVVRRCPKPRGPAVIGCPRRWLPGLGLCRWCGAMAGLSRLGGGKFGVEEGIRWINFFTGLSDGQLNWSTLFLGNK